MAYRHLCPYVRYQPTAINLKLKIIIHGAICPARVLASGGLRCRRW